RCGRELVPHTAAANSDDLIRHDPGARTDGPEAWHGERGVRASRQSDYRWPERLGSLDGLHRARRVPRGLPPPGGCWRAAMRICRCQVVVALATAMACSRPVFAQGPQLRAEPLTLKEAENRAVRDHPEIRVGQFATLAAGEEVRQVRSAYYPTVVG